MIAIVRRPVRLFLPVLVPFFAACATQPVEPNGTDVPSVKTICPNYVQALRASVYPREAVERGLTSGSALVEFTVRGFETIAIRTVRASDPVFAEVGERTVRAFRCDTGSQESRTLTIPFTWLRE